MSLTRVTINKKIKKGKKKYSTFLKRKLIHGLSIDQLKKAIILKHKKITFFFISLRYLES